MKNLNTFLVLVLTTISFPALSQSWNNPNEEFTYTSPTSSGDSIFVWKLKYDSLGNAHVSVTKSGYLGNHVSTFHMSISDAVMQPVEGNCDAFVFSFESNVSGYKYYVFDMDNPENKYTECDGKKELVIACMCKLGSGCCIPQAHPDGHGLNVTCNVEQDCLRCDKPHAYYIDASSKKKTGVAWNGATLVIKAKVMTYKTP